MCKTDLHPIWLLSLAALAVLVLYFATSLPGGFYYDDYLLTRDGYGTTFEWRDFWEYKLARPFTLLTYYLDYLVAGFSPGPFVATSILVHAVNVLLCGLLVWLLTRNPGVSVAASLIFGFHFAVVESVNYVWARSVLLSSTGVLAGLCVVALRCDEIRAGRLAAVGLCFVVGFLARPDAVLLFPLVFVLVALFQRRYWQNGYLVFLGLLAVSTGLVLVRLGESADRSMGFDLGYDWKSWAREAVPAFLKYFEILVRPDLATFCHPNPDFGWHLWPGFMVCVGLLLLLVFLRADRLLIFGALMVFGVILFTFLVPNRETLADRRIYLAVAGISLVWVSLIRRVSGRLSVLLGAILVCSLAVVTAGRNLEWSQPPAALVRAETIYPRSSRIKLLLGDYFSSRNPDRAVLYLEEALALDPKEPDAATLLGNLYLDQGKWQQAEELFREELEHRSGSAYALNSMGVLCVKLGRPEEADYWFRRALRFHPDYGPARHNLEALERARRGRRP